MAAITYETVFIAEPEVPTDQVDQLLGKIKQTITTHKGTITNEDRWGRRRLAYTIHGHREGFYTVVAFNAEPTVVSALDHLYNVTDSVMRHLTVRLYKSKKKFAPRRERPAGAPEGHRPGSGRGGPRRDYTRPSAPPASAATPAAAPAASPAPESAPAPATPRTPSETGGTPS